MIFPAGTCFLTEKTWRGSKDTLFLFEVIEYDEKNDCYICFTLHLHPDQKFYTVVKPSTNFLRRKLKEDDSAYMDLKYLRVAMVRKNTYKAIKIVPVPPQNISFT